MSRSCGLSDSLGVRPPPSPSVTRASGSGLLPVWWIGTRRRAAGLSQPHLPPPRTGEPCIRPVRLDVSRVCLLPRCYLVGRIGQNRVTRSRLSIWTLTTRPGEVQQAGAHRGADVFDLPSHWRSWPRGMAGSRSKPVPRSACRAISECSEFPSPNRDRPPYLSPP